ncbi:MAG: lactate utilization protein C [Betaproteobacteria bacterium]|nr:lactate utilization protein C [Betaproteobacteria bacterium]MDH3438083.1 lactate utilization protein C [Betaproteobacteria bacterium]
MSMRDNILARIRARQARSALPAAGEREAVRAHIAAHPQNPRPAANWDPVARFREEALKLASTVDEVESLDAAPAAISRYLEAQRLPREAVCWEAFGALNWRAAGIGVAVRAARETDLVGITGAFCAIAETGTLITLSGSKTPSAVSLLPETHVAIVEKSRIVRGMEEAWELMRAERGELPRAVNFISGPSRTADIEQTVTLGAHGPYRVHIILVGNGL